MAKTAIIDLAGKPHLYRLADDTRVLVAANGRVVVDDSLVTETIKREYKANLIALSPVKEVKPVPAHITSDKAPIVEPIEEVKAETDSPIVGVSATSEMEEPTLEIPTASKMAVDEQVVPQSNKGKKPQAHKNNKN